MSSILAREGLDATRRAPGTASPQPAAVPLLRERRLMHSHSILLVRSPQNGANQWQSAWHRRHPRFRTAELRAVAGTDLDAGARGIVETALSCYEPVVVVAESLGCLAAIQASRLQSQLIAGALLVSPAAPPAGAANRLMNVVPQFPTVVVLRGREDASARTWVPLLVDAWGSELLDLSGDAGQAADPEWDSGLDLLERLCRRVAALSLAHRALLPGRSGEQAGSPD